MTAHITDYFSGLTPKRPQPDSARQAAPDATPNTASSSSTTPNAPPGPATSSDTPPTRSQLMRTAQETIAAVDDLRRQLPYLQLARSTKHSLESLPRIDPNRCPSFPPARVRVVNGDTFNAALRLGRTPAASMSAVTADSRPPPGAHVAVLNFANHRVPGGGWLNGAVAQEESLAYRSSLHLSLTSPHPDPSKNHYPLAIPEALYSPDVVILRDDMPSGHRLLTPSAAYPTPADLPLVSVLTVAALCQPPVHAFMVDDRRHPGLPPRTKYVFATDKDRSIAKAKMRLALRIAARNRHALLVLGALGCGAFANPPEDVAHCWREVLVEDEFSGGWWREIWFAVYDPNDEGNYELFDRILGGMEV